MLLLFIFVITVAISMTDPCFLDFSFIKGTAISIADKKDGIFLSMLKWQIWCCLMASLHRNKIIIKKNTTKNFSSKKELLKNLSQKNVKGYWSYLFIAIYLYISQILIYMKQSYFGCLKTMKNFNLIFKSLIVLYTLFYRYLIQSGFHYLTHC